MECVVAEVALGSQALFRVVAVGAAREDDAGLQGSVLEGDGHGQLVARAGRKFGFEKEAR